jgi:hypothetical protein
MAYARGRQDYEEIAREAADPDTQPVEIDEDEYFEMLGYMPPTEVPGGWLVPEPITGHDRGTVVAHFAERSGRFYARYSIEGQPDTYIPFGFA